MKILCVFGKYQYGKKERGINTEYFSFVPALESLGCEVVFFDSWDKTLYKDFKELNIALVETVKKEKPDIIFSVQFLYEIWCETWDFIRADFKCKTVNWCSDDSWKYKEHSKFLAPHFDLMVTTYEEFLPLYKAQNTNALLCTWATPMQWIQKPKKANECKYQVSFVGAAHGNRKKTIEKLNSLGIAVQCFGYGWENGAIDAKEIPKIYNDSLISLNFANSSGENQIKARVFEVTGSGGFLLTENAKNLDKVFSQDEIVIYEDIEDCAKKINYFIANDKQRDEIALRGFEKTSTNYTYANTMKSILDELNHIKKANITQIDFQKALNSHESTFVLKIIKGLLLFVGNGIYGKEKGKRFARRLAYEFSWRVFKEDTYNSKGIVGRMFYDE